MTTRVMANAGALICILGLNSCAPPQMTLMNVPANPITAMSASCDQGKPNNAVPATQAVRIHLTPHLLSYLDTGTSKNPPFLQLTDQPTTTKTPEGFLVDEDNPKANVLQTITLPNTHPNGTSTRLDLNLNSFWPSPAKPILIKVMLDDPNLKFIESSTAPNSQFAIQEGTKDPSQAFDCPHLLAADKRSVEFRVRETAVGDVDSLNIGLQVQDSSCKTGNCYITPVIIDPKVPNNGVALYLSGH